MRFFTVYGLLVGTVTTCVAVLFALVIDTEPDLNGRPDTTLPTAWPSGVPTDFPSGLPSDFPTAFPSGLPSDFPTGFPTAFPTGLPSDFPSDWLTAVPTFPTDYPTGLPTDFPTFPSLDPSAYSGLPTDEWAPPTGRAGGSLEAP